MTKKAKTIVVDLPLDIRVSDRVKLRAGKRGQYREACKLAGYDKFDEYATHTITRISNDAPGGGRRLWVEKQPFCFGAADVQLAWSSERERRAALGL
jgi:hypothetical protein